MRLPPHGRGPAARVRGYSPGLLSEERIQQDGPRPSRDKHDPCGRSHRIIPARAVSPHRGLRRSPSSADSPRTCMRRASGLRPHGVDHRGGCCRRAWIHRLAQWLPAGSSASDRTAAAHHLPERCGRPGRHDWRYGPMSVRPNLPRRNATRSCSRLPRALSIKRNAPWPESVVSTIRVSLLAIAARRSRIASRPAAPSGASGAIRRAIASGSTMRALPNRPDRVRVDLPEPFGPATT